MTRQVQSGLAQVGMTPQVRIITTSNELDTGVTATQADDVGAAFVQFRHRCTVNNGHVIYAKLHDPYFNVLKKLTGNTNDQTFLQRVRRSPVSLRTQIGWLPTGFDQNFLVQTPIEVFIVALQTSGDDFEHAFTEFVAIDPGSWFLSNGDASGRVYSGTAAEVVGKVVGDYAPDLNFSMNPAKTNDSSGLWPMMRQDPKSFILSILEWATPLTSDKTAWMVYSDSDNLTIETQHSLQSLQRGMYHYRGVRDSGKADTTVADFRQFQLLVDGGLSLVGHRLSTQGISAVSGYYYDQSGAAQDVFGDVRDEQRYVPKTDGSGATSKRDLFTGDVNSAPDKTVLGYTSIPAVPEPADGQFGIYERYIAGYARGKWLNLENMVMRVRVRVTGDHIWSVSEGLGVDTVWLDWKTVDGEPYLMNGNWLVTGFEHHVSRKMWWTDLYLARTDWDATGQQVGM